VKQNFGGKKHQQILIMLGRKMLWANVFLNVQNTLHSVSVHANRLKTEL